MKQNLFCLFILLFFFQGTVLAGEKTTLPLPPSSLAQWYKPQNKRQVWLHTMFRLRREMLAVADYAALQDQEKLKKWAVRLTQDYRKIMEMVPEWEGELALDWADHLAAAATAGNFKAVLLARDKLEKTCNSCHGEFRAQAALLYRSPSYHEIELTGSGKALTFPQLMQELSDTVNRIKIASEDGRSQTALEAATKLRGQLQDLSTSCPQCHQDEAPLNRILGPENKQTLTTLAASIQNARPKETEKLLGKAAVAICARCHAIHRTLADIKELIEPMHQ